MKHKKGDNRLTPRPPLTLTQTRKLNRQRLEWLLEFARTDVEALGSREWKALRERVAELHGGASMSVRGGGEELSREEVVKLARTVASGLRALARGELWSAPLTGRIALLVGLHPPLRRYVAAPADAFLLNALELIAIESKRLRLCAWDKTLFVGNKRGIYCSTACSRRRRFERFQRKHGVRELRRRRSARYHAKVAKTKGRMEGEKRVRPRQARNQGSGKAASAAKRREAE